MVAVVEVDRRAPNLGLDPLPDIDFNIRCGNTLVGYANEEELNRDLAVDAEHSIDLWEIDSNSKYKQSIDEEMEKVSAAYDAFKSIQMNQAEDMASFKQAKHQLAERLSALNDKLNQRLHAATTDIPYHEWMESHQPFHWLAEFYQIIKGNGGFDVVIGNPPYVEYSKVKTLYQIKNYETLSCGNLYAFVCERVQSIRKDKSKFGMIIPHSSICTDRMKPLHDIFVQTGGWFSTYDTRPSHLFDGVDQRLLVFVTGDGETYTTKYNRWAVNSRCNLFNTLVFSHSVAISGLTSILKIGNKIVESILKKVFSARTLSETSKVQDLYYHNAPRYFIRFSPNPPYFYSDKSGESISGHVKKISTSEELFYSYSAIYNSTLFYLWFILISNCRDLTSRDIEAFPVTKVEANLSLVSELFEDYDKNANRKETFYKSTGKVVYDEYYPKLSKPIIDKIDFELAKFYGFTDEELDFIINYDIKYRMGDELNSEE
jgi:hypothetical protein